MSDVTHILDRVQQGDPNAADELLPGCSGLNDSRIVEAVCLRHSDGPMDIRIHFGWLVFLLLLFHISVSFAEPGASPTNTVRIAAAQAERRVVDFRLKPEEALAAVD